MNVFIFLGPPGVGKGTMAEQICKTGSFLHISTGDLLRAELKAGSQLGLEAKGYMEAGKLVPDELVAKLVAQKLSAERAKAKACVFDGYPRTVAQAELLAGLLAEQKLTLDAVVCLEAPETLLVARLSGRRVCRQCGKIYHMQNNPPPAGNKCSACGGEVYQRADDQEAVIRNRLKVYAADTAPLIQYYDSRKKLRRVDTVGAVAENFSRLQAALSDYL